MLKKIKNIIFALGVIATPSSLISCNPLIRFYNIFSLSETDLVPADLINDKEVKINSLSNSYSFRNKFIKIFEHKENKEAYVNLVNIFQQLPEFFDGVRITKSKRNPDIFILTNTQYNSAILFSIKENRIYFNDMHHFDYLRFITHNPTLKNNKIKIEYKKRHISKTYKYFDLNKYNMNVYEQDKNIFIPFSLFNLLFISPNYLSLYYNNKQMYLLDFLLNEENKESEINAILDRNTLQKRLQTSAERETNYNYIKFVFENLYGNRKEFLEKHKYQTFEEFFEKTGLKERILSPDSAVYTDAYIEFVHKYVDELHTTLKHASYFNDKDYRLSAPDNMSKKFNFSTKLHKSNQANKLVLDSKIKNGRTKHDHGNIEIIDDIAFIDISSFALNKDENRSIYNIMQQNMRLIKARKIKNVVINIAENGGGNVVEMETLAGYFSNNEQYVDRFDNVTREITKIGIKTDTNEDSEFDERDGYSDINWYLIVSEYTFSAGNLITKIAKNNKNVKVIGKQTGGGMYSIMPIILPDGTGLIISSNNGYTSSALKEGELKYEYDNIENGVMVDIPLEYEDFFNYEKIAKQIKEGKI